MTHALRLGAWRGVCVRAALGAGGVVLALTVWWAISLATTPVRLPGPSAVLDALRSGWTNYQALQFVGFQTGGLREAVGYTTLDVLIGVGIGWVLGLALGTCVGAFRLVKGILGPPLMILGTTPVLVVLPFLLIWFGTARFAQFGLVIFFTLVTVAATAAQAIGNVSAAYGDFATSLGARRGFVVRKVMLPAILPEVLGGIRVSLAAGWSFATVSELIGGQHGTGKILQDMAQLLRTADVLAAVLVLGMIAVTLDAVVAAVGGWVVRWKE